MAVFENEFYSPTASCHHGNINSIDVGVNVSVCFSEGFCKTKADNTLAGDAHIPKRKCPVNPANEQVKNNTEDGLSMDAGNKNEKEWY